MVTHLEPDILECEVKWVLGSITSRRQWQLTPVLLPGKFHGWRSRLPSMVSLRVRHAWATSLSFSLSCIGAGMATHSSVLAWIIPGTEESGGLLTMGSHRVGHDWSDLAAAAGSNTSNKASGGDGISSELSQIPKYDAVKMLQSIMSANLENSAVATGPAKVSFHSNPKERQCQKNVQTTTWLYASHTLAK